MEAAGVEPASVIVSTHTSTLMSHCCLHNEQSQPIIGVRWVTTILPFLSGPDQPIIGVSVMGDEVTRLTRSLLRQRERGHC